MSLIIERTLEFDASPERLWKAISDPREIACWFPDRAELELAAGAEGALIWDDHGTYKIEVVEVDPPTRLVWRWAGGEERPLQEYSTTVEWTVTARDGGGSALFLRESGFDTEKNFQDNSDGWNEELGELVEYLGAATDRIEAAS